MSKSRQVRWKTAPKTARRSAGGQGDEPLARIGEPPRPPPVRAAKRRRANPETGLTSGVVELLTLHRDVAWCERINTGATFIGRRFIRFGFKGCSDVIGQMTGRLGGAFLAIETKSKGKYPTKEQRAFLKAVADAGGCSGVARSVEDAGRLVADWVDRRVRAGLGDPGPEVTIHLPINLSGLRQVAPARKPRNSTRSRGSSPTAGSGSAKG